MSTLTWILAATLLGGVLSVLMASLFAYAARPAWIPRLVSFAVGTLLGAVFLEILPHALDNGQTESVTTTVLIGLLAFFVLEKLVLWRHCHHEACEVHGKKSHGPRMGLVILVGDAFHNFVDGILIAGAFLADIQLGIITALAIIAHELPQEVGDFLVLLHSGFGWTKALQYNLLSSLAMVVGGLLGYLALAGMQQLVPFLLAVASSSMIYVAVADLIPGLHKRAELSATLEQVLLIGLGIGAIGLIGHAA